ncbi:hypothetical protein ACFLZV_03860 [Candidatus Margulisiibacteriota bacterium]
MTNNQKYVRLVLKKLLQKNLNKEQTEKIEKIIREMKCPKNFQCAQSVFKNLCNTKDCVLDDHLECLEDNYGNCPFSVSFGFSYYCSCPLLVYFKKESIF